MTADLMLEPLERAIGRFRGCLMGLAVGDALGAPVEFEAPGSFQPVTSFRAGGPFKLSPGEWTDDTSLALCLAESLTTCKGFDPSDQMLHYLSWLREGHLSVNGRCFDVGSTTLSALERFERTAEPFAGSTDPESAGNGSLMRLAPVPMAYFREPEEAIHMAGESSRTTHGARQCVDACRFYAGLIVGALRGASKEELLASMFSPVPGLWEREPLCDSVANVAKGSFKEKEPPAIRGGGHVIESFEAALWAFHKGSDFREGALLAVNLGSDADTTGAIFGQLAGAYYRLRGIPEEWTQRLAKREVILGFADRLYKVFS